MPPSYQGTMVFRGRLPDRPDGDVAYYVAAAPPDLRCSFTGSGLPFKDVEQAFYNTPNRGEAPVSPDGGFELRMMMPNAFHADGFDTVATPPTVYVVYRVNGQKRQAAYPLSRGLPFRSLSYPRGRTGPRFYDVPQPDVRSQEAILRASAYPSVNAEPDNFWGGRPPV